MYKFNKILVGLDHSSIDKDLIKGASELCKLSGSTEIFFVNVIKDFEVPEQVIKEFPHLIEHALEDRKKELEKSVEKYLDYDSAKVEVNVIVEQGVITKTLIKTAAKEKIDLIVIGRKNEKRPGVLVTRIARRAPCSLLIIPKGKTVSFDKILVPTDFSNYSKGAMEKAISLATKAQKKTKLVIQNVFQVPTGYHYAGKSFEEFADIMKENIAKEYSKFMSQFNTEGLDIQSKYSLDKNDNIIDDIVKEAKKIHANMIIIGAKGRTATAALFIGSKAERMVQINEDIPMLVIRPKGKGAGFIDYIREL
ncbi:universal stress protein [Marinoscillum sp. MHG1-6]|uniref:universal stress protein n=1 Tax=Marinoscillum sp. MHG1-6 TaxID=2959627 RepID=UPI0021586AD5|nr:universal stress protein [Marinoscillum sp. MHG1-6]